MLVCVFTVHLAHETAGAARTRSSLRPLSVTGGENPGNPRAHHAARRRTPVCYLKNRTGNSLRRREPGERRRVCKGAPAPCAPPACLFRTGAHASLCTPYAICGLRRLRMPHHLPLPRIAHQGHEAIDAVDEFP